jgi:hypothetical protein
MSSPAPASSPAYQANLYPAVTQQSATTPVAAICLSGGGSRALTCALGQLSALNTIADPDNPSQTLLQRFPYISSVSGGSWASVLYTFLPSNITDQEFLISPSSPGSLTSAGVSSMSSTCLGSVPQQFSLDNVIEFMCQLFEWKFFDLSNSGMRSWFWIAGMGEFILKPFGLYAAQYSFSAPYLLPSNPFSVSQEYVDQVLIPKNSQLQSQPFYTTAPGRPTLIVNMNLMYGDSLADPPQMPVQATAVATGAPGCTAGYGLQGGGSVESFAFSSTLTGPASEGGAAVTVNRWYSLCDIAGCSSAFFAEYLLQYVNAEIGKIVTAIAARFGLNTFEKILLTVFLETLLDGDGKELLPAYNYWPLNQVSEPHPANQSYGFSDGGDFDNTGILGVLAQTSVNRIVAFINSEMPVNKVSGSYFVDTSLPLLFGSYYPSGGGPYTSYGGMSPSEPMSYVQVFDNTANQLDTLCEGLYNASCGGPDSDSTLGTYTAVFTQTLTTVVNPVANIAGGREVTVVWIYNNRVNDWQKQITDTGISTDLTNGQSNQTENGIPVQGASASGPLVNFPYYNTELQICLPPEAVNMLAQLSAWNVQSAVTQIQNLFTT